MALTSGTRLGSYEIRTALGAGGMGEVYRAHDPRLGRDVALKVLPAEMASDPARLERFTREARAIAALNHPHIVTIYSTEEADGIRFLTMELVEGQSLDARIPPTGIPLRRFLELAMPLADALTAAHQKQITHRDLKPANVMVAADGRVKVLDFGLAVAEPPGSDPAELATAPQLTVPGTIIGTLPYMSPEQLEGTALDHRTDLFSLGVMFYEMLTGARPFGGTSAPQLISSILRDSPAGVREAHPDLPESLNRLIKRCLEKQPANRVQTAREVYTELVQVQQDLDSGPGRPPRSTQTDQAPSIVVLPFANRSPDPDNEYFSDGLTEEIIADLARIGALRVISQTTAMRLKQTDLDVPAIAARLNVRYVLEGSVRKAGGQLRITAQLVDTATDSTLWSDKFNGTLEDVFDIQERVSREIVKALRLQLTEREHRALQAPRAPSAFVYDTYLRARRDIWSFVPERLERAEAELKRALEAAGDQVLLYSGLGLLHWQYINGGISSDRRHLDEAAACARKILELDPSSASGPQLLGLIAVQSGNVVDWIRYLRRAVELDPHDPYSQIWLAFGWTWTGFPEHARPIYERMLATDPLFDYLLFGLGFEAYFSGDYPLAARHYEKAFQIAPDHPAKGFAFAQLFASMGELDRVTRWVDGQTPDPQAHPLFTLAHILKHAVNGQPEAVDALMSADLEAVLWSDFQYTHVMAQANAVLGRTKEALRWLRRSVERGFLRHAFLTTDPLLARLHDDPDFAALMTHVRRLVDDLKTSVDRGLPAS
jgi:serine/threonine protein kinase/tetratricopeptide (TPR) repeat protein